MTTNSFWPSKKKHLFLFLLENAIAFSSTGASPRPRAAPAARAEVQQTLALCRKCANFFNAHFRHIMHNMNRSFLLTTIIIIITAGAANAQEHPLWMRYPAISPDGSTILFSYKGDIYTVSSKGGTAMPLTITSAGAGYHGPE